jgi:hypothetical protein
LISVSVQDIRPDPQNTSNFYLANIYGAISDPNRSNISNPLPSPPTFSPPTYAIWVNALWFLSLVISLTCALLATLLQQWARRYLKVTQPRYSPHKRARIRAFFAEGVDKFFLPWAVEVLPTLLHVSLFLFFAGLAVFLCNVNFTIFKLVIVWVIACTVIYACGTIIPIFRHDSPYHTPLLLAAWSIVTGMSLVAFRALRRLTFNYFGGEGYSFFRHLEGKCLKLLEQGMQKTAEGTALSLPSDIDTHAFLWTFDSLDEDHELERFFSGLPGFRNSKVVDDPLPHLNLEQLERLSTALIGFFDRSSSSDLLPEAVKRRRAIICAKAIDSLYTPKTLVILDRILFDYRQSSLLNEIVRIVRGWGNIDKDSIPFAEATVCRILASMKQRDDPWFIFASNELGVPEAVLRDYARHGDSLSLSVLTHITRQQFNHFCEQWPREAFSQVLQAASQFNVQDTSPVLQHEFCTLWNQIVLNVQKDNNPWVAGLLLGRIRNVYIALHHDTNATPTRFSASTSDYDEILSDPSSYPLCNLLCHHPDSTPHIHDNSASTSNSRAVPHDGATPAPASLSNPDAPFSPTQSPSPLPIANSVTDVPPLDNDINIPGSSHAHQTAIENLSTTSQDPFTARISEGGSDTSTTTTVPSTPELSLSTPPTSMASPSPPYDVSIQQIADCRSSLDALDIPSLPSPTALLDNLPHTGL